MQTGFGRTGRMFAMEHFSVEPDLMIVAKSIAAGLPLSGVIGTAAMMDVAAHRRVGGTYIGNPVALAAALAVLDVFAEEELVARANVLGDRDPRAHARLAGTPRRGSATCAGSARCSRSSWCTTADTKEPAPELASRRDRGGARSAV